MTKIEDGNITAAVRNITSDDRPAENSADTLRALNVTLRRNQIDNLFQTLAIYQPFSLQKQMSLQLFVSSMQVLQGALMAADHSIFMISYQIRKLDSH